MNIKPIDGLNNLFAIKDVLPEELLDELATIEDFMELPFTKMAGQEGWNRRTITVEPDSVFSKINQFINSQRELISASIGENIVMACPNYWMDLEEFTVGVHVDNPHVNIVMQLYLSDCDNAGTVFYNIEEDEIVISCYGLTYKPNVDDFRESPALEIVSELSSKHKGKVLSVEPFINNGNQKFKGIEIISSEEAKVISNIAVILVNHDQFKALEHSYWAGLKVIDISGLDY